MLEQTVKLAVTHAAGWFTVIIITMLMRCVRSLEQDGSLPRAT